MNKTLAIATPTLLAALVALASHDAAAQLSSTAGKTAAAVLNTKVIGTITVTKDALTSLTSGSLKPFSCSNFQLTATAVKKVTQAPSVDGGLAFHAPEWTRTAAATGTLATGCTYEIVVPAGSAFTLSLAETTVDGCYQVMQHPLHDTSQFGPLTVALGTTTRQMFTLSKTFLCAEPPH